MIIPAIPAQFEWKISLGNIIEMLSVGVPALYAVFKIHWTFNEHLPHSHIDHEGKRLENIGASDIITYRMRK